MGDRTFVSNDGSPLPVYLALPAGEAPSMIDRALGGPSTILELGSGPGRITRVLVALGHTVTAVDDSPEMLGHVTGAETVCADVFQLALDRRFDAVVAGSNLINRPGAVARRALLEVCARHVDSAGTVLIERHAPGWLRTAERNESSLGPVELTYSPGALIGDVRSASMTYRIGRNEWRQDFAAEDVPDSTLQVDAAHCGLEVAETIDPEGRWIILRLAG